MIHRMYLVWESIVPLSEQPYAVYRLESYNADVREHERVMMRLAMKHV
jgi:hypothetical protein